MTRNLRGEVLGNRLRERTLANDREIIRRDIVEHDPSFTAASLSFAALERTFGRTVRNQHTSSLQKLRKQRTAVSLYPGVEEKGLRVAEAYENLGYQAYEWFRNNPMCIEINGRSYFFHRSAGRQGLHVMPAPFVVPVRPEDITRLVEHDNRTLLPGIIPDVVAEQIEKIAQLTFTGKTEKAAAIFQGVQAIGEKILNFAADMLSLTDEQSALEGI